MMSVKLLNKGTLVCHFTLRPDALSLNGSIMIINQTINQPTSYVVGMVMAQVSLKAALKKWDREAEESVRKEMKQLHW